MLTKLRSFEEAALCVKDSDVVTVSSSSGLGCPDAMLKAIGERFEKSGQPRNLTMLHPIAAGDMSGIKGIDHIAQPGLIAKVIAGSYPSGPSRAEPPKIWQMILSNQLAAYNIPSGILFDMHREAAAKRPGLFTEIGLDTFVDPRHEGGAMNTLAALTPISRIEKFDGREWIFFPNIFPNVAILRATTADEFGNLTFEHEGAYLGGLEQALACRNNGGIVIAQVKRIAAQGSLKPHDVRITGNLVDIVVVDPDQMQTTLTKYDPAISGEIRQSQSVFAVMQHGLQKLIARRVAQELASGDTVNLGFGVSANVPRILLEENLHGEVTWVIEQGAVGGVPLLDFAFGCSSNAHGFMPSPQQFTYFQGAGFDATLLSFLEIGEDGSVNVSKLNHCPHVTAGCGGFLDITARARKIVFSGMFNVGADITMEDDRLRIAKEGKQRKLVNKTQHVTFSGRRAKELAQDVTYITERCVMKLTKEGVMVTEIAPGIDMNTDVLKQSEFGLLVSPNLKKMSPQLFAHGQFGLRLNSAQQGKVAV